MLRRVTFCCHFFPCSLSSSPFLLVWLIIWLKKKPQSLSSCFSAGECLLIGLRNHLSRFFLERCLSIGEGISYRRPTGSHYGVLFQRMANPRAALCFFPMRNIRGRVRRPWLRMSCTSGGGEVLSLLYLFFPPLLHRI